jgi:hypothetical protein
VNATERRLRLAPCSDIILGQILQHRTSWLIRAISVKSSAFAPYLIPISSWCSSSTKVRFDILLHVLPASIGKVLSIPRTVVLAPSLLHEISGKTHRARPIRPDTLDAARVHLLKANNKDTIGRAVLYKCPGKMQTCRTSRTCVVGVIDWNARHAELVEDSLS